MVRPHMCCRNFSSTAAAICVTSMQTTAISSGVSWLRRCHVDAVGLKARQEHNVRRIVAVQPGQEVWQAACRLAAQLAVI